jgi:hypothetical protein
MLRFLLWVVRWLRKRPDAAPPVPRSWHPAPAVKRLPPTTSDPYATLLPWMPSLPDGTESNESVTKPDS